jgi:hypothetical protein
MKTMGSYLLKTLSMVILTMPLALEASAEMTMKNIQIQSCTSQGDSCLTVKSPSAQVSTVKPIYFMNNIEIEIGNPKNPSGKSFKTQNYSQAYLDFDSNQLVLQNIDKKGNLTEEVYNLTTLQKQVFVTR